MRPLPYRLMQSTTPLPSAALAASGSGRQRSGRGREWRQWRRRGNGGTAAATADDGGSIRRNRDCQSDVHGGAAGNGTSEEARFQIAWA